MRLPFLDRVRELERLGRALDRDEDTLLCLYGRRRCGKSRLIREAIGRRQAVYYVGDARAAELQRADLAREIGRLVPGFEEVAYPDWEPLLGRWWSDAPPAKTQNRPFMAAIVTSSRRPRRPSPSSSASCARAVDL